MSLDIATLEELKSYLKIPAEQVDEDDRLGIILSSMTVGVGNYLRRLYTSETKTDYHNGGTPVLVLEGYPVISVTSVTDTLAGTAVTLTDLNVDLEGGMITYKTLVPFSSGLNRWVIVYEAGESAPEDVKLALLMMCANVNASSEGFASEKAGDYMYTALTDLPPAVKMLLESHRRLRG